jgi:hypothetical protein
MITKNATTVKRLKKKFKKAFRQFDKADALKKQDALIEKAIEELMEHGSGRRVLAAFHAMAKCGADSLDTLSFHSLMYLVQALRDGRRDFLDFIPIVPEEREVNIRYLLKSLPTDEARLKAISGVCDDDEGMIATSVDMDGKIMFSRAESAAVGNNYLVMLADKEGKTERGFKICQGDNVRYLGHVPGGMVKIRFDDGVEDICHPALFPRLRK